jgi:hypothetical protein
MKCLEERSHAVRSVECAKHDMKAAWVQAFRQKRTPSAAENGVIARGQRLAHRYRWCDVPGSMGFKLPPLMCLHKVNVADLQRADEKKTLVSSA